MRPAIPAAAGAMPRQMPLQIRRPEDLREALPGAIARACAFLESAQVGNGRWLDFRDQQLISSQWVTAYVGAQLARAGTSPAAVRRACAYLLASRHPAGGWGFNLANPPDADSIANVIHLLVQCPRDESVVAAVDEAVALLPRYWVASAGGYRTYHPIAGDPLRSAQSSWCDVHPSVTAMCAMALAAVDGHSQGRVIAACAGYLRSLQRPDGLWNAYWWDGTTYVTYHAARVFAYVGDVARIAQAGEGLLRRRRADGGWGNSNGSESAPFHTALAASTLLLDPARHSDAIAGGLAWLVRAQEVDGGWPAVPVLQVPRPDVHEPWGDDSSDALVSLTPDRNRLFTTATVLAALLDGSQALATAG